jgi:hypothetical protein
VIVSAPLEQDIDGTGTSFGEVGPLTGDYLISAKLVYLTPYAQSFVQCHLFGPSGQLDESGAASNAGPSAGGSRSTLGLTGASGFRNGYADVSCRAPSVRSRMS